MPSPCPDLVEPSLRAIEREVDDAFLSNPLTSLPFTEAVWHFLSYMEDTAFRDRQTVRHAEFRAAIDNIVNHAKWPLLWLRSACVEGGSLPAAFSSTSYEAAHQLLQLAENYEPWETMFTYASKGYLQLRQEDRKIFGEGKLAKEERYDAYDRLTERIDQRVPGEPSHAFFSDHIRKVRFSGGKFWYPITHRLIQEAVTAMKPVFDPLYSLPDNLSCSSFTLLQFRKVSQSLSARCLLHVTARDLAAMQGCEGLGITSALLIFERSELIRKLHHDSGVPGNVVAAIVTHLTYGAREQKHPDIATQPLIPISCGKLAISPSIFMSLSLERNLTVLINRIPAEQANYALISVSREARSRDLICQTLAGSEVRTWFGNVSGWGRAAQVDLVITSDTERCCFVIELKSFISPAEPSEIIHRSEELAKGLQQLRLRQQAHEVDRNSLFAVLGIDTTYCLSWVLCSDNSIGAAYIQDEGIPILKTGHFAKTVRQLGCRQTAEWLSRRLYLPVTNIDFKRVEVRGRIAKWEAVWYGITLLTRDHSSAEDFG